MTVHIWPSTDANGWNVQFCRNTLGEVAWDFLKHDGEATSGFKHLCIGDELLCLFVFFGSNGVRAELVDGLWRQAQMAHDRNACRKDALNRFDDFRATFQLHSVST